jgi:hypothetical protein
MREVLLNEVKECFSYVGLDVFTKWRVEPDDVSFSVSSLWCRCVMAIVCEGFGKSAVF